MTLRYGSVCSGIEAASVAWEQLGWTPAWFSEIEAAPSAVLAQQWPDVQNIGDMTLVATYILLGLIEAPDVLVGGTPCQAFSVAGARKSLDDDRGQLTMAFIQIVNAIDEVRADEGKPPCIVVWENVPGVLRTSDNAFGCFLAGLAGEDDELRAPGKRWSNAGLVSGPCRAIGWRVLDAQYFGLAQRRKRVFVVASAAYLADPGTILFESEGLRRNSAPSRETRQDAATGTEDSTGMSGISGPLRARSVSLRGREGGATAELGDDLARCLRASSGGGDKAHVLVSKGFRLQSFGQYADDQVASTMKARDYKDVTDIVVNGRQDPCTSDVAYALDRLPATNAYLVRAQAVSENQRAEVILSDVTLALNTGGGKPGQGYAATLQHDRVRRLTPVECERLQGFPDHYTDITFNAKPISDSHRYRALGNSMAVNVMRWIGQRIQGVVEL